MFFGKKQENDRKDIEIVKQVFSSVSCENRRCGHDSENCAHQSIGNVDYEVDSSEEATLYSAFIYVSCNTTYF